MSQPVVQKDQARLWKSEQMEDVYLFKARFQRFIFSKHTHEGFAIGVIEHGAQKFHHRGGTHIAPSGAIITVNPDEAHDGETAVESGYRYRMAYLGTEVVGEILSGLYGPASSSGYFRHPVTFDPHLSERLHEAFVLMEKDRNNRLESQTCFIQAVAELFMRHTTPRHPWRHIATDRAIISTACEYIRARAAENISLKEIARTVGLSRFHFLRLFKATTGLPPHAYLIQRRVELAKQAIEAGHSLADAAILSGFADQSHLTRRFKAIHGITPGQYKKALHG